VHKNGLCNPYCKSITHSDPYACIINYLLGRIGFAYRRRWSELHLGAQYRPQRDNRSHCYRIANNNHYLYRYRNRN
jgi:hypothetical protein